MFLSLISGEMFHYITPIWNFIIGTFVHISHVIMQNVQYHRKLKHLKMVLVWCIKISIMLFLVAFAVDIHRTSRRKLTSCNNWRWIINCAHVTQHPIFKFRKALHPQFFVVNKETQLLRNYSLHLKLRVPLWLYF